MHPKPHCLPTLNERLPERKAVTIAMGFRCMDGVVLCADQQIGAEGWHKFHETKMFPICSAEPAYSIMLTYAGHPNVMKTFHQKLWKIVEHNPFDSILTFEPLVEQALSELTEQAAHGTNFLCGFCMQGAIPALLRTEVYTVHQVSNQDCIGVGDSSLVRFLTKILVSHPMNAFTAALIGNYIVKQAKSFVDGCGGETDIWILRSDGRLFRPWPKQVEKSATASESIEQNITNLIWTFSHQKQEGYDPKAIELFWDDVRKRLSDFIDPSVEI
jgi:hypothetical protein